MTKEEWLSKIDELSSRFELIKNSEDHFKIKEVFLGKKGELTCLLKKISEIPPEDRKEIGKKINELKSKIEDFLSKIDLKIEISHTSDIDITLPSKRINISSKHPITITLSKMIDSFKRLGFSVEWGPIIEEDFYNFEALNFPPHHPARDMQDTFYIDSLYDRNGKNLILRTHTSPVQIRTMIKYKPPIRVISPGRVFRSEAVDATHSFVFNQIEGFYVDRRVTMCDLKWTLESFIKDLFGNKSKIKFMPSYFPFVEPGAQVEVSCVFCNGSDKSCKVCRGSGWIEMLGAGIIHPNVLRNCNYDPYQWSGFAFGAGVERFTMLLFGIDDLRLLYENDLRILRQI